MLKDFLIVHAAPGRSRQEVQHYLQHQHAPLALTVANSARWMRRYTMNHVETATGTGAGDIAVIVEHELGGYDGIASIMADEDYIARIVPDEQFMIETLMNGPPGFVIVDSEITLWETTAPGPVRVFDFVRSLPGMTREDFLLTLTEEANWAINDGQYRSMVPKRVHSIVGTGPDAFGVSEDPFDAVIETWLSERANIDAVDGMEQALRSAYCDPARSFRTVTQEHRLVG